MKLAEGPRIVYWDACAWIGLINSEPDKIHPLRSVWEAAQRGEYRILVNYYVYLELTGGTADHGQPYPLEETDELFEELLRQPFVRRVQLDFQIARLARKLKRDHHKNGLKKRPDAIHLATAVYWNCLELHTFDRSDLLVLDGKVERRDGGPLRICKPGVEHMDTPLFAPGDQTETVVPIAKAGR
jgi:predicted nucleic acid-binding protein